MLIEIIILIGLNVPQVIILLVVYSVNKMEPRSLSVGTHQHISMNKLYYSDLGSLTTQIMSHLLVQNQLLTSKVCPCWTNCAVMRRKINRLVAAK
jgi:hypothetical protein